MLRNDLTACLRVIPACAKPRGIYDVIIKNDMILACRYGDGEDQERAPAVLPHPFPCS